MNIDVNNAFTLLSVLFMLITGTYKLAKIEANLNKSIDELRDKLVDRFYEIERKVDVHLTEYCEKKDFLDYRLNDIESQIEHKFNRLANWVKQIGGFLNKNSDFHVRDDQF